MKLRNILIGALALGVAAVGAVMLPQKKDELPLVAVANYGPHASLEAALAGLKQGLKGQGYIEGETVRFEILDVGFDHALIPQMINRLKAMKPDVMVTMTTPGSQVAKGR